MHYCTHGQGCSLGRSVIRQLTDKRGSNADMTVINSWEIKVKFILR